MAHTIITDVIICLNPQAYASRHVYETFKSLPKQEIFLTDGVYQDLLADKEEVEWLENDQVDSQKPKKFLKKKIMEKPEKAM
jgi:hypothetical protein